MAVNSRLNFETDQVSSQIVFDVDKMRKQFATKNFTDPEIREMLLQAWCEQQNRKGMHSCRVQVTDGLDVKISEGVTGNTIMFTTNSTFRDLLVACPELANKKIYLDFTAQLRIEDKPVLSAE